MLKNQWRLEVSVVADKLQYRVTGFVNGEPFTKTYSEEDWKHQVHEKDLPAKLFSTKRVKGSTPK